MSLKDKVWVLIVDDMSTSRGLLTQALEGLGIRRVRTAENGLRALETLAISPAHLVISDIHMPEMDGIALLAAMRQDDRLHEVPVILTSGTSDPQLLERGRELGMNGFLEKPFDPLSVRACIESVIGRL